MQHLTHVYVKSTSRTMKKSYQVMHDDDGEDEAVDAEYAHPIISQYHRVLSLRQHHAVVFPYGLLFPDWQVRLIVLDMLHSCLLELLRIVVFHPGK